MIDKIKSDLTESNKLELKKLFNGLDNEINELKILKNFVVQINKSYVEANLISFNKLKDKEIVKTIFKKYPSFKDTLMNISLDIKRQANQLFKKNIIEFKAYCKNEEISLSDNSPIFIINNLLKIHFNERKHSVKIGNTYLKNIDLKRINKTIKIENDRIWERNFNYGQFYEDIIKYYSEILKEKPNPVGWIRLEDIYQM